MYIIMNLYIIISYDFIRLILNRCFGMSVVRHSTHHDKFLVATNGLILYVVSWQAARSILPPSYRAATHSSQFKHTVHRTLLILEKFNGYKSQDKLFPTDNRATSVHMYMQNSLSLFHEIKRGIRTREDFHSFQRCFP